MGIDYSRIIDLSQEVTPRMPVWPGDPHPWIRRVADLDRDGYYLNLLILGEQSGTHLGAPAHLFGDGRESNQLMPEELVVPAVVVDVSGSCTNDPDYRLSLAVLEGWEQENGRVPQRCIVLLHTGWARFWEDERRYRNMDSAGVMHFPGFGLAATKVLVEERGIRGLGIDTLGIDPGNDQELQANRLLLGADCFHLENLTNLDRLPPRGITLVIGALKIAGGSGSPARVLAFV